MRRLWAGWRLRAGLLRRDTYALYLAYRDPRVPWYAKVWAACVVGYAFSPIDLIPDFIPVLGYLDDLVLVPLGVVLAVRLVPPEVWRECRARSEEAMRASRPVSRVAVVVILIIWLSAAVCTGLALARFWTSVA
jgi:uncharacterized membrane protein YkvA (DUF1232 family)